MQFIQLEAYISLSYVIHTFPVGQNIMQKTLKWGRQLNFRSTEKESQNHCWTSPGISRGPFAGLQIHSEGQAISSDLKKFYQQLYERTEKHLFLRCVHFHNFRMMKVKIIRLSEKDASDSTSKIFYVENCHILDISRHYVIATL